MINSKEERIKIFVWPDDSWCTSDELEGMLISGSSDDYTIIQVDPSLNVDEIGDVVCRRVPLKSLPDCYGHWPGILNNLKCLNCFVGSNCMMESKNNEDIQNG